jgi:O-antigen ligase
MVRASYVLTPLSIVLIKYFPDLARYYDSFGRVYFSGIGTDKNMLGMTLTACALAHIWALTDRNLEQTRKQLIYEGAVHWSFLGMIVWLLVRADCATAAACITIGAAVIFLLRIEFVRKNIRLVIVAVLLAGPVFTIPEVRLLVMEPVVTLLGRETNLTDRDILWGVLISQDIDPLVGEGAYSFWMGERIASPLPGINGRVNQAHNAYLEMYLNVGWIGVILYLGILAKGVLRASRDLVLGADAPAVAFRLAFVVVTILYGLTEAIVRLNLIWFGLLIAVIQPVLPQLSQVPNWRKNHAVVQRMPTEVVYGAKRSVSNAKRFKS